MEDVLVTARKHHRCQLCFEPIGPGTRYIYQRLTPWDHPDNEGFSTFRAHQECYRIWATVLCDRMPGDKQDWLDLLEDYSAIQESRAQEKEKQFLVDNLTDS